MVTSAAPNPVRPKMSAPANAIAPSPARAPAGALAQLLPFEPRRHPFEGEGGDVLVVERTHRDDRAAERAFEPAHVLTEARIVVHEVHHEHAARLEPEKGGVVELGGGELRHVRLVVVSVYDRSEERRVGEERR